MTADVLSIEYLHLGRHGFISYAQQWSDHFELLEWDVDDRFEAKANSDIHIHQS